MYEPVINSSYVSKQSQNAHTALYTASSPAAFAKAAERIKAWDAIVAGIASESLSIGKRTPTSFPSWVTLVVANGGFATGAAAAEIPLDPLELAVTTRVGAAPTRAALNSYYLTAAGLDELKDAAVFDFPEEAALPIVAWLFRQGEYQKAAHVLRAIEPLFGRLRFAPLVTAAPAVRLVQSIVDDIPLSMCDVRDVREGLSRMQSRPKMLQLREAINVWAPLNDTALELWCEVSGSRGREMLSKSWVDRCTEYLSRYDAAASKHKLCKKHARRKENGNVLRCVMRDTVTRKGFVPPSQWRYVRNRIDAMVAKRGRPGSVEHSEHREQGNRQVSAPSTGAVSRTVLERMKHLPVRRGLAAADIALLTRDVSEEEANDEVAPGTIIPKGMTRCVRRALEAPLAELVSAGAVPSAEALATLAPRLAAAVKGAGYSDEALGRLMAAHHVAFSKRRSLLLLNLESQVREEELPWANAVSSFAGKGRVADGALDVLGSLFAKYIEIFPGTIMPNPLVKEFRQIMNCAGSRVCELPLTDELAADIFMGAFSSKFKRAAKVAAKLLRGGVYEKYYEIDYEAVLALDENVQERRSSRGSPVIDFASLCDSRAHALRESGAGCACFGFVATNGSIIEQQQILTTHNLAVMVEACGKSKSPNWKEAAQKAFKTVCGYAATARCVEVYMSGTWARKAAFAWRQVVFYVAMVPREEQIELLNGMHEYVTEFQNQRDVGIVLFSVLNGLATAAGLDWTTQVEGNINLKNPLVAWCGGEHPLLESAPAE